MKQMGGSSKFSEKIMGKYGRVKQFFGIFFVLLCLCGMFTVERKAEAASAAISIETKNSKVQVGDTVYIVVTVRSSSAIKGFEGYFTYDHQYLKFVSGGSVVHGNDDAFRILDMERAAGAKKLKYSVKFKARRAGGTSISLKKPYNVLEDDGNNSKMSVSYNSLFMAVENPTTQPAPTPLETKTPPKEKKNKNTPAPENSAKPDKKKTDKNDIAGSSKLRSLTVQGTQLTPDFSPDIEKYSGVISTSKEQLPVEYEPEDSGASVKVSGNKKIKDGKNVIKVTVKNTEGKKTTYRLSLTVQKITPEEDSENSRVNVVERSGKFYMVGTTTICAGEAQAEQIPDDYERISMEVKGKNITCYAREGDTEAEYVLIYGEEEQAFYLYDKETDTLLPYEKVKMWYLNRDQREISTSASLEEKIESYQYVLAIMGVFCALMLVLMLYFAVHSRSR